MAPYSGYTETAIGLIAGNTIAVVALAAGNVLPVTITPGTNGICFGHIQESGVALSSSLKEKRNERKAVVYSAEEDRKQTTKGKIMQVTKDNKDFLAFKVAGKTFLEYKYQGVRGGKHIEIFKLCQIASSMSDNSNDDPIDYESNGIAPAANTTFDSTALSAIETALGITIYCSTVTINANEEYAEVNTTVS